jgi:hypothetical protein
MSTNYHDEKIQQLGEKKFKRICCLLVLFVIDIVLFDNKRSFLYIRSHENNLCFSFAYSHVKHDQCHALSIVRDQLEHNRELCENLVSSSK